MADGSGGDLSNWRAAAGEARGVVLGGEVAHERCDTASFGEDREEAFEQRGLAGAGARYQAHDVHTRVDEAAPQRARQLVVVLQNVLANLHQPRGHGDPSSISSAVTSSSRPSASSMASRDPATVVSSDAKFQANSSASLATPDSAPTFK